MVDIRVKRLEDTMQLRYSHSESVRLDGVLGRGLLKNNRDVARVIHFNRKVINSNSKCLKKRKIQVRSQCWGAEGRGRLGPATLSAGIASPNQAAILGSQGQRYESEKGCEKIVFLALCRVPFKKSQSILRLKALKWNLHNVYEGGRNLIMIHEEHRA